MVGGGKGTLAQGKLNSIKFEEILLPIGMHIDLLIDMCL